MTQGESGPVKHPDTNDHGRPTDPDVTAAKGRESKPPERPGLFALIGLVAVVLVTLAAVLALLTTNVSYFPAVTLLGAGSVLFLALKFTQLSQFRVFQVATSVTVVAALLCSGGYVTFRATQSHSHPGPTLVRHPAVAPRLNFVLTSPATVPWCNYFYLQVKGVIPPGDEILIFDASTDSNYNVTSHYSYDKAAKPVSGNPGEWVTRYAVYPGSKHRENENGTIILKHGRPVSNAGYTVVVSAAVVTAGEARIMRTVTPAVWGLTRLPTALASAELDTKRNGDVTQCAS
jgi:hypothetical protein